MPLTGIDPDVAGAVPAMALGWRLPHELVQHVLDFFPQHVQIASSSGRGTVVIWSSRSNAPLQVLREPNSRVVDTKFLPGGNRLVTATESGDIVIWDTVAGKAVRMLRGHGPEEEVLEVQVFPDGDRLVTLGSDGLALLWSAASGEVLQRFDQNGYSDDCHRHVRVLPDGGRIVTGISFFRDSGAIIWNVSTGLALHRIHHRNTPARFVEMSPDGSRLVTTDAQDAWLWRSADGEMDGQLFGGHEGWINGVAFADRGNKVVASCSDWHATIWDIHTGGRQMLEMKGLRGIAPVPLDERLLMYTGRVIAVWNLTSGETTHVLSGADDLHSVVVSAESDAVAACTTTDEAWKRPETRLWSLSGGKGLNVLHDVYSELWPSSGRCLLAISGGAPPLLVEGAWR